MKVKLHMIEGPIVARPDDGLRRTHERMREHDIHHMPVLDAEERVVGIVSEHDILVPRYVDEDGSTGGRFVLDDDVTVARAMTRDPLTLRPGDTLADAIEHFLHHRFSALPVVDEDEHLVGMLTTKDLLLVLKDQLD